MQKDGKHKNGCTQAHAYAGFSPYIPADPFLLPLP